MPAEETVLTFLSLTVFTPLTTVIMPPIYALIKFRNAYTTTVAGVMMSTHRATKMIKTILLRSINTS